MKRRRTITAALALLAATWPVAGQKWVMHLPSSSSESASRQADALTRLADVLAEKAPGLRFEPQLFRRIADTQAFLQQHPAEVELLLCDAALVPSLPEELEPIAIFVRGGKKTYRRLLVVGAGSEGKTRLAELRGKSVAFVESGGSDAYFGQAVFGGLLQPKEFFGKLVPSSDEIAAIGEVLFGQTDAALVADFNPLLVSRAKDLRVVFTSDELPLPVLAVRADLEAERKRALATALAELGRSAVGREIFTELGLDGLEPVPERERLALRQEPAPAAKRFELAPAALPRPTLPSPPPAAELPLTLELGLPRRTPFSEILDAIPAGPEAPVDKPGGR